MRALLLAVEHVLEVVELALLLHVVHLEVAHLVRVRVTVRVRVRVRVRVWARARVRGT